MGLRESRREWRALFAVVAALLLGLTLGGASETAGASTSPQIYWGALIQGSLYGLPDPGVDTRAIGAFESRVGRHVSIVHVGQSWYGQGSPIPFPRDELEAIRLHGTIPLLTWGSRDGSQSNTNSPSFRNSVIASGVYDAFIRSFATAARDWGHPFFLRFDWEMNGWWYPWGQGKIGTTGNVVNGNSPGDYVRMWRHVHDIFDQVGATNVTWVWCLNQMSDTSTGVHPPMSEIYPGDAYVDWTSYDAYNRYGGWESFYTASTGAGTDWCLNTYQALLDTGPSKPMMVAEFGSKEDLTNPQRKPDWLTDALVTQIPKSFPQIKAIVYYSRNTSGDIATDPDASVAIESSQLSTAAFSAGINSGYYASDTFANLPAGRIQPLAQGAATPPGAPVLTATPGTRMVSLHWSTPAANGSPVTGYRISRGTAPGAEAMLTTVGPSNDYLDAEVEAAHTYYYSVAAVNAAGVGATSSEASATPTGVGLLLSDRFQRTVLAGFGSADDGHSWSVSSTARTKVSSGEGVIYGWTGGNQDVSAAGTTIATNMDVTALVRLSRADPVGGNYSPRVVARAQPDARDGYSARITHTPSGAMSWLLSRTVNAGGAGSSTLAGGTLAGSGAAGSRWWIRLRAEGPTIRARFWRDGSPEPTAWAASVTDSYWVSGRAALGVFAGTGLAAPFPDTGFSVFDAVDLGQGAQPLAPSAPVLTSVTGGNGSVSLAWSPPSSDGGAPLSHYTVYRGTSSGGETFLATVGTATTYSDAAVASGTTYYYTVSAANSIGTGPPSNEKSATTQAATGTAVVRDTFSRSVAAGFGNADVGGTWAVSSAANAKVESGAGVVYGWTGSNQDFRAWLPSARANTETLATVRLGTSPTGASYQSRIVARAQSDARNGYAARIIHQPSGAVTWGLSRVVNAGGTGSLTLGSGPLLASGGAGTSWSIRLRVVGTSIEARFWRAGTAEPTSWMVNATDGYWATGFASVGVLVASGSTAPFPSVGFDDIFVVVLGS